MLKNLLFFALIVSSSLLFGQNKRMLPYAIQEGTLNEQFTNLNNMSRSGGDDFKLIRKTNLEIIRTNVLDSISRYQKEIASFKTNSSSSASTIRSLRDSVSTLEAALRAEQHKTDSISFLGIDFSKGSYHTFVWSLITVLALAFIAVLASFRKAKVDTNEHKNTADQLQGELQALRKKSLEKEQQLKRQLLDEQLKRNP